MHQKEEGPTDCQKKQATVVVGYKIELVNLIHATGKIPSDITSLKSSSLRQICSYNLFTRPLIHSCFILLIPRRVRGPIR